VLAAFEPLEAVHHSTLLAEAGRHVLDHDNISSMVFLAYSAVLKVALVAMEVGAAALHGANECSRLGLLVMLAVCCHKIYHDLSNSFRHFYHLQCHHWASRREAGPVEVGTQACGTLGTLQRRRSQWQSTISEENGHFTVLIV
jgi:hypothetical protein